MAFTEIEIWLSLCMGLSNSDSKWRLIRINAVSQKGIDRLINSSRSEAKLDQYIVFLGGRTFLVFS